MANFIYPMVEDLSSKIITESIDEVRGQNWRKYLDLRQKLKDFYDGEQTTDEYLYRYGFQDSETKSRIEHLPPIGKKLTQRVIDRISLVYKKPPERHLVNKSGDALQNDPYVEWIGRNKTFHTWLKAGERMHNLLHNVLLRPVYNANFDRWRFYIETDYIAYFSGDDKINPVAYDIPIKHDVSAAGEIENQVYLYISDEYMFLHDENDNRWPAGELEDEFNPYGTAPLIDLTDFAIDEYWQLGEKTLVEANQTLNIMILNGMYAFHFQAFDQPWVQTNDKEKVGKIQVGPHRLTTIPDGSETGLWGFSPQFDGMASWLNWFNSAVLEDYGLEAHFEEGGQIPSGIALKIKNLELLENREEAIDKFRLKEDRILQVVAAMSEYHGIDPRIPKEAELSVDYAEVDFPKSDEEVRQDQEYRVNNGYATKIDILMEMNPDLDREAAIKEYERIKQENAEIVKAGGNGQPIENEFRRILEEA